MKSQLLSLLICLCSVAVFAQGQPSNGHPKTIYYAPDGNKVTNEKIDSVVKFIGGRFNMDKKTYGNDSVVIRLVKMSNADIKAANEADEKRASEAKARLNMPAANFSLKDLQGNTYTLSNLKGKVVILNFWFTTCPPCIAEIPQLNTIVKKYDPAKVVFLSITFNEAPQVKDFLKHNKFDYHHLVDGKKVCDDYHVFGYPTHMVIDKKGILRFSQLGGENIKETLSQTIEKFL